MEEKEWLQTFNEALAPFDLDRAGYYILSFLNIEPPRPARQLIQRVQYWPADAYGHPLLISSEYLSAGRALVRRGMIQRVDRHALDTIHKHLEQSPTTNLFDELPALGTSQFTFRGGELWQEVNASVCRAFFDEDPIEFYWHYGGPGECLIYAPTRINTLIALRQDLPSAIDDESEPFGGRVLYLSGPSEVGPWRPNWWKRYESGFCLDIHYEGDD